MRTGSHAALSKLTGRMSLRLRRDIMTQRLGEHTASFTDALDRALKVEPGSCAYSSFTRISNGLGG